jgi:hypothetical protein
MSKLGHWEEDNQNRELGAALRTETRWILVILALDFGEPHSLDKEKEPRGLRQRITLC